MNHFLSALAFAAVVAANPANAATTVNLAPLANASTDGSNAVAVDFAAGTYRVTFTQDQYTAFNRFGYSAGCDGAGENCQFGFENSARFIADGVTYLLGDGDASGGVGPLATGNGYYRSAAQSFANAGGYAQTFTLATRGTVRFFIPDDFLADNIGGISLDVTAVPEPATWALMIAGFGLVGGTMRRRTRTLSALRLA